MLNHFSDGVRMARTVDHPNVRVLCDYYHLRFGGELPSCSCWTEGESCWSTPTSPSWKAAATPLTYPWSPCCLNTPGSFGRSGYAGGVSVESKVDAPEHWEEQAALALANLRQVLG